MVIIAFGKPGAGKGTRVSELLQTRGDFSPLSVGNLLREVRKNPTDDLGKALAKYMDAGELVPDDIINKIVIGAIKQSQKHVILDGFPRTIGQATAMLSEGVIPDLIVEFYVEDEVVLQRAKVRIACSECGETYTTDGFKQPRNEGVCDLCGGALVRRKDDEESIVRNRLTVYKEQTQPVLDIFREHGLNITKILNHDRSAAAEFTRAVEKAMR